MTSVFPTFIHRIFAKMSERNRLTLAEILDLQLFVNQYILPQLEPGLLGTPPEWSMELIELIVDDDAWRRIREVDGCTDILRKELFEQEQR